MKRRFNFFHRGLITNLNQDVSAIETTEGGMSISSAFLPLLKDISYYPIDKLKRFLRFFKNEQSSSIETNKINVSHLLKEHYQLLAETGILKEKIQVDNLSYLHKSRLTTLVLLKKNLLNK